MHTWTVVVNATAAAGRRESGALAARGKDLVLIGDGRSALENLAAELRVIYRVDVRILALDLARRNDVETAIAWLRARDRSVDGILAIKSDDPSLRRGVEALAAAFTPGMRHRGIGWVRCADDDRSPPRMVSHIAVAPRTRTTTQRGFGDPERLPSRASLRSAGAC